MAEQSKLRITFMDGKELKFKVPRVEGTRTEMAETVERARSSSNLLLEADGELVLIPLANVRMIELDPAPQSQPIAGLLTGAKSIK